MQNLNVSYTLDVRSEVKVALDLAPSFLKKLPVSSVLILTTSTSDGAACAKPLVQAWLEIFPIKHNLLNRAHIVILQIQPFRSVHHLADPLMVAVSFLPRDLKLTMSNCLTEISRFYCSLAIF